MSKFYLKLNWQDSVPLETKVKALFEVVNTISREMSIGRVPGNKQELQLSIETTEQKLTTPLSIAFVTMAEKGEIDEVTASENVDMFIEWDDKSNYNVNDLRSYNGQLYKCLLAHTSQADWTPDVSPSLWKVLGITESGIPEWSQPISSSDAYMIGDEVMFNDVHYRSTIDNNVWSPEAYPQGWEVVVEEEVEETPNEENIELPSGEEVIETPTSGDNN